MAADKAGFVKALHDNLVLDLVTNGAPQSQDAGFQALAQAIADAVVDKLLPTVAVSVSVTVAGQTGSGTGTVS